MLWVFFALALVPRPLACLEKHYAVRAICDEAGCRARLPDGSEIPYDDGRTKSPEERLEHPDVADLFAERYVAGPPTGDPGRVRIDAIFRATYPPKGLVRIRFLGKSLLVHQKAAAAFERVAARLEKVRQNDALARRLLAHLGTYAPRNIAGTDRRSAHAWGIAIDLDPSRTSYWRWGARKGTVPRALVDAFEAEGFIWGGRWIHYDTMHFEYRPELLDPTCYP